MRASAGSRGHFDSRGNVVKETQSVLDVEGTPVLVEGQGDEVVLMLHGWPDTLDLWNATVAALQDSYTCVRLTLPGFEAGSPVSLLSLEAMTEFLGRVVQRVSPDRPVTLMIHDWGCVFGYELAMQHPHRVARIVAVDIGDHNTGALQRLWTVRQKASVIGYQLWLALAWKIGRMGQSGDRLGTHMTRVMARWMRCPSDPGRMTWRMNYAYAMRWLGTAGGLTQARKIRPVMPLLYAYGERKPFMFHTPRWLEEQAAREGCRVQGFDCGHWVMISRAEAFHALVRQWLQSHIRPGA